MQLSLTRPLWPLSPKLSQGDELQNFIFMHAWPIVAARPLVALAVALRSCDDGCSLRKPCAERSHRVHNCSES